MFDMPVNLPDEFPAPAALIATCSAQAAAHFEIPVLVVRAIIEVEGGKVGTVSKNSNNSYDLGIMQINTIHLPEIKSRFGVGWEDLTYKPCVNIGIATWLLSERINSAKDFWTGVGNYHSATKKHHFAYLRKVAAAYRRLQARTRRG